MTQVLGDMTGLPLPATPEELAAAGPAWLTRAFRAFGTLDKDTEVSAIRLCQPVGGGNSGQKALLDLACDREEPWLERQLFVKLSRDFADPFRDRRRHELEAEVRLAQLARHPAFPVAVAKPWFADFHQASGTGLLISSRIAFGEGGIEPYRAKCRDHELADQLPWYRATMTALAKLAAADQTGRLAPDIDRLFPYDPVAAAADMRFNRSEAELSAAISTYADFATTVPQLLPAPIRDPGFIARWREDVLTFARHESVLRHALHSDPRLIALTHWNTNLDNAWFWRNAAGELEAGLLDWGMVRRMNVAYGIWGGLSAAEPAMLTEHLDDLLALYVTVLADHGGPTIATEELGRHFDLSLALLAVALLLDVPALILSRMPAIVTASGPHDPMIAGDGVVEGFLKVFTNMLVLWQQRDLGRSLRTVVEGA